MIRSVAIDKALFQHFKNHLETTTTHINNF